MGNVEFSTTSLFGGVLVRDVIGGSSSLIFNLYLLIVQLSVISVQVY